MNKFQKKPELHISFSAWIHTPCFLINREVSTLRWHLLSTYSEEEVGAISAAKMREDYGCSLNFKFKLHFECLELGVLF